MKITLKAASKSFSWVAILVLSSFNFGINFSAHAQNHPIPTVLDSLRVFYKDHCTGVKNRFLLLKNPKQKEECSELKQRLNKSDDQRSIHETLRASKPCTDLDTKSDEKTYPDGTAADWLMREGKKDPALAYQLASSLSASLARLHSTGRVHNGVKFDSSLLNISRKKAAYSTTASEYDETDCKNKPPGSEGVFRPEPSSEVPAGDCKKMIASAQKDDVFSHGFVTYGLVHENIDVVGPRCVKRKGGDSFISEICRAELENRIRKSRNPFDQLILKAIAQNQKDRPTAKQFDSEFKKITKNAVKQLPLVTYSFEARPYRLGIKGKLLPVTCDSVLYTPFAESTVTCAQTKNGVVKRFNLSTWDLKKITPLEKKPNWD